MFVNVNSKDEASQWVMEFQSHSKTTMPQTKVYEIKGTCDIHCTATVNLRLERRRLSLTYPSEVNLKYTHNHVINSAESLSFRRVKEEVSKELLDLFKDGHTPASALYVYQDKLYFKVTNEGELVELFAEIQIMTILPCLFKNIEKLHLGKAILQEYDACAGKAYILCIVTGLMYRTHEKILQAGELCYVDASALFETLNTSITLFYTSCAVGALPLDYRSFYASLCPQSTSQSTSKPVQPLQPQENLHIKWVHKMILKPTNPSEETNDNNTFLFMTFLEEVKEDYLNGNPQLCAALNKFSMRYNAAKSKSISRLSTFLYNFDSNLDPIIRVKSGITHKEKFSLQEQCTESEEPSKYRFSWLYQLNEHNVSKECEES
ncbi:46021_t:CDS:2 [Gigaspora margarita]|uniref:46021_t:CDS:1 n=1 Tax=Gigaspora margarita TaxID=4874 RepID=A0ABN7UI33_GIGMA|nr:46021_t:CDS:2 [Gigaspora margarita]